MRDSEAARQRDGITVRRLSTGVYAVEKNGIRRGIAQRNAEGEWQGFLERSDKHVGRFTTLGECARETVDAFFREWPAG